MTNGTVVIVNVLPQNGAYLQQTIEDELSIIQLLLLYAPSLTGIARVA